MSDRRALKFYQADVFTGLPFGGNPVAVFPDAQGLTHVQLQQIAREMNLSETVFVLKPTLPAHTAKLRIFTPVSELPFAGHPTVGTVREHDAVHPQGVVRREPLGADVTAHELAQAAELLQYQRYLCRTRENDLERTLLTERAR